MRKLQDPETKNLSSARTDPRTQQIENEDPRAAFSPSFLPRQEQPRQVRTQIMT